MNHRSTIRGLPNIGNTCFAAAVLQNLGWCLFTDNVPYADLKSLDRKDMMHNAILFLSKYMYVSPSGYEKIGSLIFNIVSELQFADGRQHDAHEFLICLLDFFSQQPRWYAQFSRFKSSDLLRCEVCNFSPPAIQANENIFFICLDRKKTSKNSSIEFEVYFSDGATAIIEAEGGKKTCEQLSVSVAKMFDKTDKAYFLFAFFADDKPHPLKPADIFPAKKKVYAYEVSALHKKWTFAQHTLCGTPLGPPRLVSFQNNLHDAVEKNSKDILDIVRPGRFQELFGTKKRKLDDIYHRNLIDDRPFVLANAKEELDVYEMIEVQWKAKTMHTLCELKKFFSLQKQPHLSLSRQRRQEQKFDLQPLVRESEEGRLEEFEISERWKCEKCDKKVPSHHTFKYFCESSPPKFLCVVLKRFNQNQTKNSASVTFQNQLSCFGQVYNLGACILHHGTLQRGHYTSVVFFEEKYFHCDDDAIQEISSRQLFDACRKLVYILFFVAK